MSKYINVDNISCKEEYIEEKINKYGTNVYQLQPYGNNNVLCRHVGIFDKMHDVLINKFNLNNNIECVITSTVHSESEIEERLHNKLINMFKIFVNYCYNNFKYEIGVMVTDFKIHNEIDKQIKVYSGSFVISFHYDDKCIILDETLKYISFNYYMENMIKFLNDTQINNIIMDKIKKY
jgi:hypothetical protein